MGHRRWLCWLTATAVLLLGAPSSTARSKGRESTRRFGGNLFDPQSTLRILYEDLFQGLFPGIFFFYEAELFKDSCRIGVVFLRDYQDLLKHLVGIVAGFLLLLLLDCLKDSCGIPLRDSLNFHIYIFRGIAVGFFRILYPVAPHQICFRHISVVRLQLQLLLNS